ncbi:TetR/AcrR family transcriptional regulator [bacterium]|nr:TetR/AcrR family transcriptional regulator [bacterium]MCK5487971.1 TetR/AcrR family transcriptional regulator [Desulfobacterales bacterium]
MAKGEKTKGKILEKAASLASVCGLEDMSIGKLAKATGLSKSGLFAHFNSKENLQTQVVQWAAEMFTEKVMRPAFNESRGIPRIRAIFENWKNWIDGDSLPGGCVMIASSTEFDDKPGAVRDEVVSMMNELLQSLTRTAQIAIEEGHFKANADPRQFAFEFESLLHGYHLLHRLLKDPEARERSDTALERLLEAYQADLPKPH